MEVDFYCLILKTKTLKEYQFLHDTPEFIRENYPRITKEQVDELIKAGVMRRYRKLRKPRTLFVNEKNGSILYYNYYKEKFEQAYYFIDENHPLEKIYQQKLAEKQNKQKK